MNEPCLTVKCAPPPDPTRTRLGWSNCWRNLMDAVFPIRKPKWRDRCQIYSDDRTGPGVCTNPSAYSDPKHPTTTRICP